MSMMIDVKLSLFDNIRRTRGLWFGVIDGAQVDDVVSALAQTPLQYRPLYIGLENKPKQLKTAPFLVSMNGQGDTADSLPDEDLIKRCFHVAKIPSACVFWHCNGGEEALYHHLRSINKIIIPQEQDGVISDTATETVLFRHADANVMTQVLPALNSTELSRLLGSAELVLARPSDEWGGRLLYAARSPDMPEPHNGFLQLTPQTYQQITFTRHQGIVNKIEHYLDKHAPAPKPAPDELKKIAKASYIEAYKNGVNSEGGFNRWAYLYCISKGQFAKDKDIQNYLREERHGSIDQGLENYMSEGYELARAVMRGV